MNESMIEEKANSADQSFLTAEAISNLTTEGALCLSHFLTDESDGYFTVFGYLAKTNPVKLFQMNDKDRLGYFSDKSQQLHRLCFSDYCRVVAPLYLFDRGFTDVKAYPEEALREVID